ncbi:MAG: DsbA family protein [Alphaproteobacteria bacterium]|nr:DsbA family protein [Alphaproteobacteria bacterium]
MKKIYLGLLSFACFSFVDVALAEDAPIAKAGKTSNQFSSEQVTDIKKLITEHITENPTVIMAAFQAGMAEQQKEELAKVEKAVADNKDKIFKNANSPVAGNPEGKESLVVFMDPYCGYCKKFHGEIDTILSTNKDVKITFVDIPIMGPDSIIAVKAMLAAKEQGKYDQLQKAIFSSDKHLTKKQILKIADSLGIDKKKLEKDMNSKGIQAQVDHNSNLATTLGINGTPTLIIGETKVVPGFVSAEEVNKTLKETAAVATDGKSAPEKGSTPEKAS